MQLTAKIAHHTKAQQAEHKGMQYSEFFVCE